MERPRMATSIAIVLATFVLLPASAPAAGGQPAGPCPPAEIQTASGCTSQGEARSEVEDIVNQAVEANDLRAALVRVDVGNRTLATVTQGESMAGVPASQRMHFRIGSMAIPYLINLLLQLQDEGLLSLDDPVSNWLPDLANADQVTLRMLANSTSGYPDWAQGNPAFIDTFHSDVFRQWKPSELLAIAFDQPLICQPGACFHYAHTNFAILSKVIHEATGKSVGKLIRKRVFAPFGLRHTDISRLPGIPGQALHAYTVERGPYEDSTFWSPSWTIGKDTVMTGTIGDIIKSARAVGTGAVISPEASREQFAPGTAGFGAFSQDFYYGLGILVMDSWQFQNPQLNGYKGIMAYLPPSKISVALTVTNGQSAAETDINYSQRIFNEISAYLAPNHPVTFPG